MMRRLTLVAATAALSACTLGPDYERPDINTPDAYVQPLAQGQDIADVRWWDIFDDPVLQQLIETALVQNRDLARAAARVEEARALFGFAQAERLPNLSGSAIATRGNSVNLIPPGSIDENYGIGGFLSWDADIFGRLRRSSEAARAELLSAEETQRAVTIALIADVASNYLLLRDFDSQFSIAQRTLESRTESLRIISERFDKGTVPLIDVNQAQIEQADAAASLASIERQQAQTENLLNVLIGRNPGPILRGRTLEEDQVIPFVPAGLPSELLERRPDVRAAEASLAAQTARIGIAEAARWPSLSLTGALGLASTDLSDLIESDSEAWNLGADLTGPLFDFGRTRRNVEVEVARTEQLLRSYELTVQQAFQEVEDALVAIRTLESESSARQRQVEAARSAATLSRARYDGGVTSYLEVLDSERSLFSAELLDSAARRAQLTAYVNLYRALGGGWGDP